jgi:hypothetical protein
MGTEILLGWFVAPGELREALTWDDGRFLARGECIPAARVAAWDDAGYVEWASRDTRDWFERERVARRVTPLGGRREAARGYPDRASERRGPVMLLLAGVVAMFLGCGFFFMLFGASMTDASTPSPLVRALTPWAGVAAFALVFAPMAIIAGAIAAWQQRGR